MVTTQITPQLVSGDPFRLMDRVADELHSVIATEQTSEMRNRKCVKVIRGNCRNTVNAARYLEMLTDISDTSDVTTARRFSLRHFTCDKVCLFEL